jgi:hypothetical protein
MRHTEAELRLFDVGNCCVFPDHAATTSYRMGCRCDRCRNAKRTESIDLGSPLCAVDGCTERRAKRLRTCVAHVPAVVGRTQRRASASCEMCGREHGWYESQLNSFRSEIQQLYRDTCNGCRSHYMSVIKAHRLDSDTAKRLILAEYCDLCGKPFSVGHRGRKNCVVDHDHGCCPGAHSCGSCVRGVVCQRCNHALAQVETLRDVGLDVVLAYLQRPTFIFSP